MKRLILTVAIILLAMLVVTVAELLVFPIKSMDVGVRQLEDSNAVFQEVQSLEYFKNVFEYVIRSQQLEDVAEAKRKAALKDQQTILIKAEAEAVAIDKLAEAEANRIEKVNVAAEKAQKNPLFYQLRLLEVENKRISKWDGKYPQWYMGGGMQGASPDILLNMDTVTK